MPSIPSTILPIEVLVRTRCQELALTPADLVRRCGYSNVSKGLRRLQHLCAGNFATTTGLIRSLPDALGVPVKTVTETITESQRQIREAKEGEWRAAFRPHAVILTEKKRPDSLLMAAIGGIDVLKRVDFDLSGGPVTFVRQTIDGLKQRLARWKNGEFPFYGKAVGFVVNYAPDNAVQFDLGGKPVAILNRAYELSIVQLSIGGRAISEGEVQAVFSGHQG